MKAKFLLILLAVFLPLSASVLNAGRTNTHTEIPLHQNYGEDGDYYNRSVIQLPIECCYLGMMDAVVTTVWSDLGDVTLTVTNCSTGSVWYDSFDSAQEPQTALPLSGEPGIYQIVYITESGGVYEGSFTIQ